MKQCSKCKEIKNEDNENFYFRKDMNKFYGMVVEEFVINI